MENLDKSLCIKRGNWNKIALGNKNLLIVLPFVCKVCKTETEFVLCSNKGYKEKCLSF